MEVANSEKVADLNDHPGNPKMCLKVGASNRHYPSSSGGARGVPHRFVSCKAYVISNLTYWV
jgi:hypothetical protein